MNNFSSAKKRKKHGRGWNLRVAELLSIFFAIASPFFTLTLPDFFTPPFARRRWVGPVSLDLASWRKSHDSHRVPKGRTLSNLRQA